MLDYTLVTDTRAVPVQAATMYGPQKGTKGEQVALLAGAMLQLCEVTGTDPEAPFMGAAGGVPIALSWLSRTLWGNEEHCEVVPGGRFVAEALRLPERVAEADLVITGEGRFDEQSLTGKVVGTVAEIAAEPTGADTPTRLGIIAGSITDDTPDGALVQQLEPADPAGRADNVAQQLSDAAARLTEDFIQSLPRG